MVKTIIKRDGRTAEFHPEKIADAVEKSFQACAAMQGRDTAEKIAATVVEKLESGAIEGTPTVEGVQDLVEETLIESGFVQTAKAYILYRAERSRVRDVNSRLIQTLKDITFSKAADSDMKRENANIDADTAMGTMLKYGSESAKQFYEMCVIDPRYAKAHREGDIHIHDMDFYTLTTTCCQIELRKLFKGGFSTGHGVLREPNDISSYAALACIAIQSNQNDQHGGQSVCDFDYGLAVGVGKTYRRLFKKHVAEAVDLLTDIADDRTFAESLLARVESETGTVASLEMDPEFRAAVVAGLVEGGVDAATAERVVAYAEKNASRDTDRQTFQAMEALVHNLNTMHSRAGAQTPFSSVNYGMDTSPEGRMVIKNMLLATEEGLGSGETPIFPVQIFRVKEGVNYNPEDPNYDLFKLAMHCSAKRLFPNFSFLDAPFNAQYYKGTPETEIAYMGCRTRVMGNVYDPDREVTPGRGNLSFTSINLPRLAIRAKGDIDLFFDLLDSKLQLVTGQLDERFEIQARKHVYNAPFLMGQGVWIDSEKLSPTDEQREVLKHGTLTTGFIGLAECLVALTGQHHGQSAEAQRLGLEIVGHMRSYCDRISKRARHELHAHRHAGRGPVRPLRAHRPRALRRHPRRDRSRLLHQRLPRAGVLRHLRLRQDCPGSALPRAHQRRPHQLHRARRRPVRQPGGLRKRHPLHEGLRHGLRLGEPPGRPRPGVRLQRHHRGRLPQVRPHRGRAQPALRAHPPHHRLPGRHARSLQRRQARRRARPRKARRAGSRVERRPSRASRPKHPSTQAPELLSIRTPRGPSQRRPSFCLFA